MCSCRDFGMVVNVPSLSASARSSGRVDKRWQSFLNYQLQPPSLLRHKGPADWPGASAINLRTGNAATGLVPARPCLSLPLSWLVRPDRFASAPPRAHPSRLIDTFDAGWVIRVVFFRVRTTSG